MSRKVSRRTLLASTGAAAALGSFPAPAIAQAAPIKIGLLTVKVGPLAQGGIQMEQGVLTFLKETNYTIAGAQGRFHFRRYRRRAGGRQDQGPGIGRARQDRSHSRPAGDGRALRDQRLHPAAEDPDTQLGSG